jgi:hypothetical protein
MYPAGRSPVGVDDLAGNVEELVVAGYALYPSGIRINDNVAVGWRTYRITRGGSFTRFNDLAHCRRRTAGTHRIGCTPPDSD